MLDHTLRALERSNDVEDSMRFLNIKCRYGDHDWVPGDERASSCGCPSDPGIHACHPDVCANCGISEENVD